MAWFILPRQLANTGRWRMTATSDEGGGGPFGDLSHDHATAEEAQQCDQCDSYVSGIAGFPSRKRIAEDHEAAERAEYERLRKGII